VTEAAHGLADAHGQLRDGLQALDGIRRQAIAPAQHQFGVAQYAGELVVELVAENLAEVGGEFLAGKRRQVRGDRFQADAAFHTSRGNGNEGAAAENEIGRAGEHQKRQLRLASGRGHHDHWSGFSQQGNRRLECAGGGHGRLVE
jgi:hypothetical protein